MGLVDRIGKAEGALAFWDRVLKWGPPFVGTALSSSVAGWATATTNAVSQYAPLSWIGAALFGGCAFLLGRALWYSARVNAERLEFARDAAKRPSSFNPVDAVFTKQRIELQTFRSQFNETVDGKTFVDCELFGPAVILLTGNCSISGASLGNCEFVRLKNSAKIYNAIPLSNLTITRGKLRGLTILASETSVAAIDNGINGIEWITH